MTDLLEPLRRGLGRDGRPIPAYDTLGLAVRDVVSGSSTVRLPNNPVLLDGSGAVLPGALAVLADCCCGGAVASALTGPGTTLTAQMRVEFVRPIPVGTRWLDGRGEVDVVDDEGGLARGELVDDRDELLAVSSMRALRALDRPATATTDPRPDAAPVARPVAGPVADARPLLEALPVHALLGVTERTVGGGGARWTLTPGWDTANSFGAVHGGVVGMLAHLVATDAQRSVLRDGERLAPLDLVLNYYRAVLAGDVVAHVAAEVTHRGRRFVVAEGEIAPPGGRVAVRFSVGGQIRRR
jgi:uncharacterized protein (TIGR00369 family)